MTGTLFLLLSLTLSPFSNAAAPVRFGDLRWEFDTSSYFEGFAPYTKGQSHDFEGGRNYPPQLREQIEPFLLSEARRELILRLRNYSQDPRDYALFHLHCIPTSSYAVKARHDGVRGEISFRVYCRTIYLASAPVKFRGKRPYLEHGAYHLHQAHLVNDDLTREVLDTSDLDVVPGTQFGELRVQGRVRDRLPFTLSLSNAHGAGWGGPLGADDLACDELLGASAR